MKLIDIIRADQDRYTGMNVCVVAVHGTVSIEDAHNFHPPIFLQGGDAQAFISEALALYDDLREVTMGECYHHLAIPYAEVFWN